jgi:hypothetical protein
MVDVRGEQWMSHAAFLYSSVADVAERMVPLIEESLDRRAAVLVTLDDAKCDALRGRLGARAAHVALDPQGSRYTRPVHAIEMLSHFIAQSNAEGKSSVHVIGEVGLRGDALDSEWVRYEAACNEIFAGVDLQATCVYPRSMHADTRAAVAATHPFVDDGELTASPAYRGAHAACAHLAPTPLAPSRPPELLIEHLTEPRHARHAVIDAIVRDGRLHAAQNAGLVVSELVTNALLHGGGHATVAVWLEAGTVIIAVHDDGADIDDPFAGLWPPALPTRGAGLWVANHLSERMSIDRSPSGGAAVTVELAALHD